MLISGLSISRNNSFALQIELLARHLGLFGCECRIFGRAPSAAEEADEFTNRPLPHEASRSIDLANLSEALVRSEIDGFRADATILLGYPNQFGFLGDSRFRPGLTYLWAQFSHTPAPLPGGLTIVPLTGKSAEFAGSSKNSTVGPIVPHGVDLNIFGARGEDESGGLGRNHFDLPSAFTVGVVATNQLRKRFDRFLDTCELTLESPRPIHFCIKTDRPSAPGGFDLPRELADRGIEDHVTIIDDSPTGSGLPDHELARLYACFDLYLHTSEWEGFGIPVIEAMASGVPVATHRTQGPGEITPYPELLIDSTAVTDETGAVLTYIDPKSAAAVIDRVRGLGSEKRLELGRRGRRASSERYDARKVASAWIDVINRDLADPGREGER